MKNTPIYSTYIHRSLAINFISDDSQAIQMASRFLLLLAILLFSITQASSDATFEDENAQVVKRINRKLFPLLDCTRLCNARCGLHSRLNVCTRACATCCSRCRCVPPGTSGNREDCGKCYTDMTTHGNRLKCPKFLSEDG